LVQSAATAASLPSVRVVAVARIIHEDRLALTPGTRLGVYEVTAQIGVGGT